MFFSESNKAKFCFGLPLKKFLCKELPTVEILHLCTGVTADCTTWPRRQSFVWNTKHVVIYKIISNICSCKLHGHFISMDLNVLLCRTVFPARWGSSDVCLCLCPTLRQSQLDNCGHLMSLHRIKLHMMQFRALFLTFSPQSQCQLESHVAGPFKE